METIKITQLEQTVLNRLEEIKNGTLLRTITNKCDKELGIDANRFYAILRGLKNPARFDCKTTYQLFENYQALKALGKIEVLDEGVSDAS